MRKMPSVRILIGYGISVTLVTWVLWTLIHSVRQQGWVPVRATVTDARTAEVPLFVLGRVTPKRYRTIECAYEVDGVHHTAVVDFEAPRPHYEPAPRVRLGPDPLHAPPAAEPAAAIQHTEIINLMMNPRNPDDVELAGDRPPTILWPLLTWLPLLCLPALVVHRRSMKTLPIWWPPLWISLAICVAGSFYVQASAQTGEEDTIKLAAVALGVIGAVPLVVLLRSLSGAGHPA